jgi:hypothetical protein
MERDPAPLFRRWVLENGHLSEDQLSHVEAHVRAEIDDAFEFAAGGTDPDQADIYEGVFMDDEVARSVDGPATAVETMTIAQAINSGYPCAMEADDKIVILGEDVADPDRWDLQD